MLLLHISQKPSAAFPVFSYLKNHKTKFFFVFVLTFIAFRVFSQNNPCAFDKIIMRQKAAGFQIQEVEQTIQVQARQILSRNNARAQNDTVYFIPVVVHVIHNGGPENISDAQIQSQIQVLNEDFRKMSGTNGAGNGVDTKIQFCLAGKNPDGKCCKGIVRIKSSLTYHQSYQRSDLAHLSSWDATRYLNIYIVKSMPSGVLGYASFPGSPSDQDGAVILNSAFGTLGTVASPYNLGRTVSHELGHWFGLYHTFNDSCGIDACTDGDHVCDTPPVAQPNYGCPGSVNSCHNDNPDLNDLPDDYMDYTDDACKSQFTAGQAARAQATLQTLRTPIWSAANLIYTGCDSNYIAPSSCSPIADFVSLTKTICAGNSIHFMSRSLNNDTAWSWFFDGADILTSSQQNPTVTYSTPGTFRVKLIVQSANGSDSVERFNYITVVNPQPGSPNSWGDNFENIIFPANGLTIDNPDNGVTWERTTDGSSDGVASARIQNLINTNYGQADAMLIPRLDLTNYPAPIKMRFKWAYARSDANYSDELIVLTSVDCGVNWTQRFYRSGSSLTTGPTQTTLFVPDSSQWKTANIDLTGLDISDHVDIKIVNVTDGGNALYIDSLMVGDFDFSTLPNGVVNMIPDNIRVYPDPVSNLLNIENIPTRCRLSLFNTLGQLILSNDINQEEKVWSCSVANLINGVYFLMINDGKAHQTFKIIKQNP
jgi:PKD repeat protein